MSPRPLIVKLSPDFAEANERDIIPAALEAGVRIVNYGNTRRIEEPRLSQRAGGLSGPEIFPTTLDNVRRTRKRFGDALEIIGTGGVDSPGQGRGTARGRRPGGLLLHRIHHAGAHAGAAHPGTTGASLVSSAQLIHISTAIHRRGNRPDWRGLASTVESIAASFVHNIGLGGVFADDDWPKSRRRDQSAHLAAANEPLTLN